MGAAGRRARVNLSGGVKLRVLGASVVQYLKRPRTRDSRLPPPKISHTTNQTDSPTKNIALGSIELFKLSIVCCAIFLVGESRVGFVVV